MPSDVLNRLGELASPGTIPRGELVLDQSLSGKKQYKMQIASSGWKSEAEAEWISVGRRVHSRS